MMSASSFMFIKSHFKYSAILANFQSKEMKSNQGVLSQSKIVLT